MINFTFRRVIKIHKIRAYNKITPQFRCCQLYAKNATQVGVSNRKLAPNHNYRMFLYNE